MNTDDPSNDETEAADYTFVPASVASMLNRQESGGPLDAPAVIDHQEPNSAMAPDNAMRSRIAQGAQSLMGQNPDVDGLSADMIHAGHELILWGLDPKADAVAVVPDLKDWTNPASWANAAEEMDMPEAVIEAVQRLAQSMTKRMDVQGDTRTRIEFARRLGALFRQAGIDRLAVRKTSGQGFNWIALNADDLARESDGEPWTPPGGRLQDPSADLRELGVSLGQGGRVSLWPDSGAPPQLPPPAPPAAHSVATPRVAQPRPAAQPRTPIAPPNGIPTA